MRIVCSVCGELTEALYDGFGIGDQLLESVMFVVKVVENKLRTDSVGDVSRSYFDELDTEKWLRLCNKALETERGEGLNCPNGLLDHHVAVISNSKIRIFNSNKKITLREFLEE